VVAIETVQTVTRVVLKSYNPHELSPETVKSVATGREQPLEHILEIIRRNVDAPSLQHVIVSAARGYGKSFFLRYVEVRLAEIAKNEQLPIAMALLPEELPHVKEPGTLIAEIKRTFTKAPADTVGVRWVEDDGDAWDEAVAELDSAISKKFGGDRGLLVAGVENFDLLLRKAFGKSAQAGRLREFLTRRGNRMMLIAASARGAFDRDYDRPLFKAFEEIALEPWTIDQCLDFFRAQRREAKKPPLTEVQEAKAKAVATYIGGTPRLATMIGEALLEDDPLRAADLLEKLVDELTPYYKERVEVLPARSQGLLDALLRGGERCSATELARRVGAPSQPAIAAPLDELKKDLVVTGEKAPDSAEVLLRVTDRVFAHYYRKRILSHGQKTCPLEALVDLLAVIYSPEEKKREADKLAALGLTREAEVMEKLWQADRDRLERLRSSERYSVLISQFKHLDRDGRDLEALAVLNELMEVIGEKNNVEARAALLVLSSDKLGELGRHEEGLANAEQAISLAELSSEPNSRLNLILPNAQRMAAQHLARLKRHNEVVVTAFEAASNYAEVGDSRGQARALRIAAESLSKLERHEDALRAANEAAVSAEVEAIKDEQANALPIVIRELEITGRIKEALAAAKALCVLSEEVGYVRCQIEAIRTQAFMLVKLEQYTEAAVVAREAATKAGGVGKAEIQVAMLGLCFVSLASLGRFEEAIEIEAKGLFADAISLRLKAAIAGLLLVLPPEKVDLDLAFTYYELILLALSRQVRDEYDVAFGRIIALVTVRLSWRRLVDMFNTQADISEQITTASKFIREPGVEITNAFSAGNRETAIAMTRHMVAALAQGIETASDPRVARLWTAVLDASADEIATARVENATAPAVDPTFLKEIVDIYAAHPAAPPRATALLAAAAAYHERGRDPAALARLDPDLAIMLMAVFPPKGESSKRTRKSRKKKRQE